MMALMRDRTSVEKAFIRIAYIITYPRYIESLCTKCNIPWAICDCVEVTGLISVSRSELLDALLAFVEREMAHE